MFFHVFGHIHADQAIHTVKQVIRQLLNQFRLAHAGGADKDERHRPFLGRNTHTAAANGSCHSVHRLILPHDMLFQPIGKTGKLLIFLRLDLGCRDLGPHLNDTAKIVQRHARLWQLIQLIQLLIDLTDPTADGRDPLIVAVLRVIGEHFQLQLQIVPLFGKLCALGDLLAAQVHIGAGFVQQVNRLIGQIAVGDISLGQHHTLTGNLAGYLNAVEIRISLGDSLHDLTGLVNAGLSHSYRLEAALQGSILFNVLTVFVEGSGTDNLDLTSGQGGFQNVRSIHAALGITGAHQIVDFIDDQDNIAALLDLSDQALHTAFKLTTELRACHQCRQVQQHDFLIPQLIGHIASHDPLGKSLGNSSLANTGFADQAGIVLLPAVQNLNHTLCFHIPANDLIQLAFSCPTGQIQTVAVQKLVALFLLLFIRLLGFALGVVLFIVVCLLIVTEKLIEQRECCSLPFGFILFTLGLRLAEHRAHFIIDSFQVFL